MLSGQIVFTAIEHSILLCCHQQQNDYFAEKKGRLSRNRSLNIDEGFQWDEVASNLFYTDGFKAFKLYAEDAEKTCGKLY